MTAVFAFPRSSTPLRAVDLFALGIGPSSSHTNVPMWRRFISPLVVGRSMSRLCASQGDGNHIVPIDAVIETMWQTGKDMLTKYKETSLGGLTVNAVEC